MGSKKIRILGIETSCDETAIAALECSGGFRNPQFKILSNQVLSQIKKHAPYGGVVPHLAKREHSRNLVPILTLALKESKLLNATKTKHFDISKYKNIEKILEREPELFKQTVKFLEKYKKPKIDAIAVTYGPGLEPALWVGINFAKALSYTWNLPLIATNHMEGHIYSVLLSQNRGISKSEFLISKQESNTKYKIPKIEFPALALLVSGGHTELILIKDYLKYKIIGQTLDDAAGEAFDKVAKMLGLGYPGGPIISKLAEQGNPETFNFPRPMLNQKSFDFSFSGLKTAVLYTLKSSYGPRGSVKEKRNIAASFQQAVVDVLIKKTIKAASQHKPKTIILAGGVAANKELREQLKTAIKNLDLKTEFLLPDMKFTTDNAAMITTASYFHYKKKKFANLRTLKAKGGLKL